MNETIQIDTKQIDHLIKAFKKKMPVARVGVLGGKTIRANQNAQTNAQIGAYHEFGTTKMPRRSFLRVPIAEHIQKYLAEAGAFNQDLLRNVIKKGSFIEWVALIGKVGETIVLDAFDSGGFGKWKPSNMSVKQNHQTLVETKQLRDSITSEVKE